MHTLNRESGPQPGSPGGSQVRETNRPVGTGLGAAATHPPKYVQMSTVSVAEKYRERANNAVLPVGAVPAAPRQLSALSVRESRRAGRRTCDLLLQVQKYSG